MIDVLIIGAGPSGISAALYLKRANKNVEVIYTDNSSLNLAHQIDNYYGVPHTNGSDLYKLGIAQATNMGIIMHNEEVLSIEFNDIFKVATNLKSYEAKQVILATGAYRNIPKIKNYKSYEGKGLSYCATCDGFFYRNKIVGVVGNGAFAYHEAEYLSSIAKEVIIFTNGEALVENKLKDFKIIEQNIDHLEGEMKLSTVILSDGSSIDVNGLFVALGSAGSVDIARKMGILVNDNNRIVTNDKMETNLPGFYAIGDTTEGMLQIAKAVYDGALCADTIIKSVK